MLGASKDGCFSTLLNFVTNAADLFHLQKKRSSRGRAWVTFQVIDEVRRGAWGG